MIDQQQTYRADHSEYKYSEDHITPDWEQKIKHGQVVNNPFYTKKVVVDVFPGSFSGGKLGSDYLSWFSGEVVDDCCSGVLPCAPPPGIDAVIERMKILAGTKAMAKVNSAQIQALASIGEAKETMTMLRDACRFLLKIGPSIKAYGRNLLLASRSPKRFAKKCYLDAENAWMAVRMGWRPFVGECENLHAAITHATETREKCRVGASQIENFASQDTSPRVNINWLSAEHDRSYSEEIKVSAGVIMGARIGGFPDTWGLTQIPQTIWELTTLSWCVDYFFNVGNAIAAWCPDTYWTPILSWTTVRRTKEEVIRGKNVRYLDYGPPTPTSGYRRTVTTTRTRVPGLSVGITFKPLLTWEGDRDKVLDTLAVARQKMTGYIGSAFKALSKIKKK